MGDPKRKAMRKSERAAARNRRAAADAVERESWGVTLGTFSGWTRCELTEADRTEGLTGNKAYCPFSCCFRRHGFTRVIVTAYTVELDGQRAMLPDPLADLLKNLDAGEPVKLPHKFRVPMIPVAQREANKNGDVFPPGFSRYAGLASATLFTPPPRQPIPDWPTEVDDVEPDKALAVDSAFAALQRKQAEAFGNAMLEQMDALIKHGVVSKDMLKEFAGLVPDFSAEDTPDALPIQFGQLFPLPSTVKAVGTGAGGSGVFKLTPLGDSGG